jgi:hypothetical protein
MYIQDRWKANTLKRHRYTRKAIKRPMRKLCIRLYLRFASSSPLKYQRKETPCQQ